MTYIQALLLGLIQGLTEFIPVSSSAHLIIVPWLFGWTNPALTSLPFDVALHLGTLLAVLAYFAADWVRLIQAGIASLVERRIGADPDRRLAWMLVIGSIPGAIIGALAESKIDAKQWLTSDKHGTFEARKLDIVKFTNDCLAAGATGVWVSGPEQIEGKELIDMLYIELPTDAAKRAKVFAVYNKANEEDPEKDLGQKFLVYSWD